MAGVHRGPRKAVRPRGHRQWQVAIGPGTRPLPFARLARLLAAVAARVEATAERTATSPSRLSDPHLETGSESRPR